MTRRQAQPSFRRIVVWVELTAKAPARYQLAPLPGR
jgi:hypothetical protein